MASIYETTGGTYQKQGDYELSDLKLPPEEKTFIGVWGTRVSTVFKGKSLY